MPVHLVASAVSKWLPSDRIAPAAAALAALATVKGWAGGIDWLANLEPERGGPGERDLHGRVVLIVGGFTPLGLVVQTQLAARGAQIIALTPSLASPRTLQLVQLLRDSTRNELIYAEQCDVLDPHSVTYFAETWNKGLTDARKTNPLGSSGSGAGPAEQVGLRLDAIIFLPLDETAYSAGEGLQRINGFELAHAEVAARYHFVQSMLSSLLLLPPDRDIRIVSAISPWHPSGIASFSAEDPDYLLERMTVEHHFPRWQPWCASGAAALRWLALSVELQRRIQLLAEADKRPRGPLPAVDSHLASVSLAQERERIRPKANITVLNVCLGFERNRDVLSLLLPPPELTPVYAGFSAAEEGDGPKDAGPETAELLARQLRASVDPRQRQGTKPQQQVSHRDYFRPRYSMASVALRYTLAVLLWPLIWLFCKSPGKAASGITWALVAPLDRGISPSGNASASARGQAGAKGTHVRPVELHREGSPRPVVLPASVRDDEGQRRLWEGEEALIKAAIAGDRGESHKDNNKETKKRK
ncbi:hypothetical protein K437DRAFT_254624 [Tilletiaria anomala UBC 951]|uniref:Ketoreductase (KR) domain-containing protein n=1 Tax=Tilletiaria anomala (strain ATCC 24038 / CBS 436.72 / UBC 951) TaxID=1037660 RepID=A0A066WN63_TILAU|nr:uncharacterized protein K437DRAFT_254624 [Tilletiaria anomala UBC 951]KDN52070.1 hypothetical protein K437DRAFT_254624 [Tilletiaria anomala UBC 951]